MSLARKMFARSGGALLICTVFAGRVADWESGVEGAMATHITPVVLRQEVGRRIRLARRDTGLAIVEAVERLKSTRSVLGRLETGIRTVTVQLLRSWCTSLACEAWLAFLRDATYSGVSILGFPLPGISELWSSRAEVSTTDPAGLRWRRSSFSGGEGGGNDNCVEVSRRDRPLRCGNSKNADGPALVLPASAWFVLLADRSSKRAGWVGVRSRTTSQLGRIGRARRAS